MAKTVYLLESLPFPNQTYVGITERNEVQIRIDEHNRGMNIYTSLKKPWKLLAEFTFQHHSTADRFELYLKTGSGRAFLTKHLVPKE